MSHARNEQVETPTSSEYSGIQPRASYCAQVLCKASTPSELLYWCEAEQPVEGELQYVVIIYRTILHQYTHLCKTPNILKIYTTKTKIRAEVQLLTLLIQPYLLPSRQPPPHLRWNRVCLIKSKVRPFRARPRCDIVMLPTNSAPRILSIPPL